MVMMTIIENIRNYNIVETSYRRTHFFFSRHNLAFRISRYIFRSKESNLSPSLTVVWRRDLYFQNLFDRGSRSRDTHRTSGEKRYMEQAREI